MKTFMGSRSKSKKIEYPAFTNFTIKVNVKKSWQDTVKSVLKSVQGVTTFRMGDDGSVNISGYIDPVQLLKCLKEAGKNVEMVHWQYGECSNNLFENTEPPANDNGNGPNGAGDYYLHPGYDGYGNGYGYGYGNAYGYDYGYPRFASNYGYKHLECSGNAEDCNGHHAKQPKNSEESSAEQPKSSDKTSFSIPKRIRASGEDLILSENAPKCCKIM
ncbi:uncharacterized protein LOC118489302 [Helianthus annuus]|uniref:uncharacterized protein LOC118489302 n=1 Tax=Helianthus annuus TaxID=4232 RepID=UPI001652E5E4|nr:uncharacterized protein LOC118489302 [Helianthus annuus]